MLTVLRVMIAIRITRGLGGKHCTRVKCNRHGIDIPFFVFFVISLSRRAYRLGYLEHHHNFFTKRRRSAVIAFLERFPPNILAPPKKKNPPQTPIFQCKTYYRESAPLVPREWSYESENLQLYRYRQLLVCMPKFFC